MDMCADLMHAVRLDGFPPEYVGELIHPHASSDQHMHMRLMNEEDNFMEDDDVETEKDSEGKLKSRLKRDLNLTLMTQLLT